MGHRRILIAYIACFFYNIPVFNIGNEVKLFDLFFIYFVWQVFNNKNGVRDFAVRDKTSRLMLYLGAWCSITLLFTVGFMSAIGDTQMIMMAGLYLFHMWGFFLATIFYRMEFLKSPAFLKKTILWALIFGIAAALIIVLQNIGLIPYLWGKRYQDSYGDTSLSGTLGPNRVVPGITMFLMFALCCVVAAVKEAGKNLKILSYILIVLALAVIVVSGSRTTYVSLMIFVGTLMVFSPVSMLRVFVPCIVLLALVLSFANVSKLEERMSFMLNYRIVEELEHMDKKGGDADYYEELGSGRKAKLIKAYTYLMENPWYIPFGTGFMNPMWGGWKRTSAHNFYLEMIIQNGLVGLGLYLALVFSFLRGMLFDRKSLLLSGLIIACLVNIFFGETFYVFRPTFALLGLFLFVASVLDIYRVDDSREEIA